jgi:hypothetical protein
MEAEMHFPTFTPAASPITRLGHVRIVTTNLVAAKNAAARMGLLINEVYGTEGKRHFDVACRHLGPMGNHEPKWTAEERDQFAALGF